MMRSLAAALAALFLSLWKSAAYEGAAGSPLSRGGVSAQAIAAGATFTTDVEVSGSDWIVVQVDMTGTAVGDLAVTVTAFEDDGLTLTGLNLATSAVQGPTLSGGHVFFYGKYDCVGIPRVRIGVKNNNVAGQTITRFSWRAQGY